MKATLEWEKELYSFVIALREQERCLASKWNFVPLRHPHPQNLLRGCKDVSPAQQVKDVKKSQKVTSLTINGKKTSLSWVNYMKKMDKLMLVGCFLLISGLFLPWYSVQFSPHPLPWRTVEFTGTVYGFNLYIGLALVILATINILLTLVPEKHPRDDRIKMGKLFVSALIMFILIFNVLPPVLVSPHNFYFDPRWGLIFVSGGAILTAIAAISDYMS